MKIAYFDSFSGISGDMAVGAFLDAGVPLDVVRDGLRALGLGEDVVQVGIRSICRSEIHAVKFDVLTPEGEPIDRVIADHDHDHNHDHPHHHAHPHEHSHDHPHAHHHEHGHHHEHEHPHGHEHSHTHEPGHHHDHGDGHGHHHEHGSYASIVRMIDQSALTPDVRERSKAIFRAIAIGEGRIHNVDVDQVHFHEVGALDSIVDIVALAVCMDHLGIEEIYSSPIPLGSGGMIRTQHGVMPLPAPATLEILKGYPVTLTDLPYELTTPTGAGIIKALSKGTLASEEIQVERIGFGAGTRELPDRPNLLRVVIGEKLSDEEHDLVTQIDANIDDMNPQVYPYVMERMFETGALDVYMTPVLMKKGRPGLLLSVLAPPGAVDELVKVIYRETTTIGVRYRPMHRRKLPREEILARSEFGPVRMKKIITADGVRVTPEYDEARRIARERSLPLHIVLRRLNETAAEVEEVEEGRGSDG